MLRHTHTLTWLAKQKGRASLMAIGYTAKRFEEYLFDWLLYGTVVAWATSTYGGVWGYVIGFLIMTPLSALVCYTYVKVYDWTKKDWFGFELVKDFRDTRRSGNFWTRMVHQITQLGDIPAFFALSMYGDPFLTTVYLRRRTKKYHGLERRDWAIFWSSVIVSNAYWTLRWAIIVEVLAYVWSQYFAKILI